MITPEIEGQVAQGQRVLQEIMHFYEMQYEAAFHFEL
mgnify:CR=1 FL=1